MAGLLAATAVSGGPAAADDGAVATGDQASALAEPPANAPPSPEVAAAETERIAKGLRCPVCQGLSVADSNADAARAMYARIGELVQLGYDEEQIANYFTDRYGAWVRLAPPATGAHWLVWLGPVVLVVLGVVVVGRRVRPSPEELSGVVDPSGEEEVDGDPYRQRILAELNNGGRA